MMAINLLTHYWPVIAPVAALALSEYLSLNPNAKSNGIIQLVIGLLAKKPA